MRIPVRFRAGEHVKKKGHNMTPLKRGKAGVLAAVSLVLLSGLGSGCLSMKTEHEIKPIHITMDINLKVDRQIDNYLDDIYGEIPETPAETPEAK